MRKYKGTYKIPIKKHTKVRRPISNYVALSKWHDIYGINNNPLVQDIKRGLENPLWCEHIFPSDWFMQYNDDGTTYYAPLKPKSLWQRIKGKL